MRGRKKKAFARILCFVLSVLLAVPAFSMPEARAEIRWCSECMEYKDCDYCQFCGRCEDCVTICDRCGEVCLECHSELEGVEEYAPCAECGRCKEGVEYCLFCGRCAECIEMCDRCNEVCIECHEELEGVEEHAACADCGRCKVGVDYCLFCGRCADCVEICSECGEICTECHEEMAAESADESVPCPGCYRCKAGGMIYCHSCGYCEDCKDFCYGCGYCMECAMEKGLHCEECEECFEMVERCPDDGMHCTDHCIICDDCGKCMLESDEEPCEYCGLCPDCCEINQCSACGMCAEDPTYEDHFCEECGACMEAEEERCEECGLCVQCCNDRAVDMGCNCGDGCWLNLEEDHFCADCGRCFGEVDPCNTCLGAGEYRCIECCAELAELEGCDCTTPVCVNADDFDAHMATVHGGSLENHVATAKSAWSFDKTYHWHDCRLCDDAAHVTGKSAHTYNSMGICTVCGYNTTSKIVITSQPKDRHATIHYNGYYPASPVEPVEDKDNTVTFTVVAYGKNAKKGLHYQWYCKNSSKTWTLKDGSGVYSDYCSGANTSVLTIAVPNDACRMTDENNPYQFYCVITDDDGNSATSAVASMIVKHDYQIYMTGNLKNEKGHVLCCVGDGCMLDSKVLPHTYGAWQWALKADGTQNYLYHTCTVCGWKENFDETHEHQYNFGALYEVDYESVVATENDKIHSYDYEFEYQGKTIHLGTTVKNHYMTCIVPGCNHVTHEEHSWSEWHVVNNASPQSPGGLYRTCTVCGVQQTWANTGFAWHTHPLNVLDGHAKKITSEFLAETRPQAIATGVQQAMEAMDHDISKEGDVVLLLPDPVDGKKVKGAFVRIQRLVGLRTTPTEELLEVKEIIPGVAYAFTVPKSGTIKSEGIGHKDEIEIKVDYQASFINVTFEYETCKHKSTKIKDAVAATCTEIGYSGDKVCAYCEHLIEKGTYLAPKGHAAGVLATENVPALDASGKPLYAKDKESGGLYPVYKIQAPTVRTCDDIYGNKGSYTGDLICPDCGEIVEKGKYYSREHSYKLLNDLEESFRTTAIAQGYREAVAPGKGKDGYSGDYHCWVCDAWQLGHVIKSQTITKVKIEISEMPTYGSEVKDDVFTYSEGTQAGSDRYFFSWFGYEGPYDQYEWYEPGDMIDIKVNPALMELELRIAPKEGYWFPASVDEMQVYVNGKQIRETDEWLGLGRAVRLDLIKDPSSSDYGELAIIVDIAMTGFCGVAYDVNGGEGNLPCLAVSKGTTVSLAENSFIAPVGKKFDHWEIDGKSYQPGDEITVNGLVVAKAVWKELAPIQIDSAAAKLDGTIGLRFYYLIPDEAFDKDSYALMEINGRSVKQKFSQAAYDPTSGYGFTMPVYAKESCDMVHISLYDKDGNPLKVVKSSGEDISATGFDFSVEQYLVGLGSLLNDTNDSKGVLRNLIKMTRNYCYSAKIMFNHNAEGKTLFTDLPEISEEELEQYQLVMEGDMPAEITDRLASLKLESDTTLYAYLIFANDSDRELFEYFVDDEDMAHPVALRQDAQGWYLAVPGIAAKNLDETHVFTVRNTETKAVWKLKFSALTYARGAILIDPKEYPASYQETVTNIKNVGKAVYLYNKAAKAYFD